MEGQTRLVFVLGLVCEWIHLVAGHGRLWEPPGRSTMWRRGYQTPHNYDDHQLYCGNFTHQVSLGYKCGLCGDPHDGVRENETGGKYATGIITNKYTKGQKTTFEIVLTANHKGFFEFKICPRDSPKVKETQECFDRYPVPLADGSGSKFYIGSESRLYKVDVVLPAGLTCEFCVLQWRYHGGNNWGTENNGNSCVGCGYQEEFYGCADIKITASGSTNNGGTITSGKTQGPDTATPKTNIPNGSVGGKVCRGASNLKDFDRWCQDNCKAGYCPASHCVCE